MKIKDKMGINQQLMEMGEKAFWDEFERLVKDESGGERYVVWDRKKGKVVVFGAKLVNEKVRGRA